MKNNTYWYRLLTHFEKQGYIQNGLTIPFIIGARSVIEPDKKIQSVKSLINDFKNSGYFISILKCDTIGEIVFNISNANDSIHYAKVENIVIIDDLIKTPNNLEDIITYLDNLYSEKIFNKTYSLNHGEWTAFTEIELQHINELR
jgi:hypothetical protein